MASSTIEKTSEWRQQEEIFRREQQETEQQIDQSHQIIPIQTALQIIQQNAKSPEKWPEEHQSCERLQKKTISLISPFIAETEFLIIQKYIKEKSIEGDEAVKQWWLSIKYRYSPAHQEELIRYALVFDLNHPLKLFELDSFFIILDLVQMADKIDSRLSEPFIRPDSPFNIFIFFLEHLPAFTSDQKEKLELFKLFMRPEIKYIFLPSLRNFLSKLIRLTKYPILCRTLAEFLPFDHDGLIKLFEAWNIADENIKKIGPYCFALISSIMKHPLDLNFEVQMQQFYQDEEERKHLIDNVYHVADKFSNPYIHQPANTPVRPAQYSINFMWVNRFKVTEESQFFIGKDEADFQKKIVDPLIPWMKKNPETPINFWIDSELIPPAVMQHTLGKMGKELGEENKNFHFQDIRSLPEIKVNSTLFDEHLPVYLRVDVARACVLQYLMTSFQSGQTSARYAVYSDMDASSIDSTELFDQVTINKLNHSGIVLMRGPNKDTAYENGFQILDGKNEKGVCQNALIISKGLRYLKKARERIIYAINEKIQANLIDIKINQIWKYYKIIFENLSSEDVTKYVPVPDSDFITGNKDRFTELQIILSHFISSSEI